MHESHINFSTLSIAFYFFFYGSDWPTMKLGIISDKLQKGRVFWSSGSDRSRFCVLRSFFFNVNRTMVWALPTLVLWSVIKELENEMNPFHVPLHLTLLSNEIRFACKRFKFRKVGESSVYSY